MHVKAKARYLSSNARWRVEATTSEKRSGRGRGVSRTPVFNPVSACVSRYLHSAHWWSTVVHITQPVGRAGSRDESTGKSFRVIRMFHIIMLSCVFWVARALHWCIQCVPLDSLLGVDGVKLPVTLVVSWWRGSRGTMVFMETSRCRGCYSGYRTQGYIAQWLERLTADQQVPGSIPGEGHGLSSWQDPTIWWIIPHSGTTLWAQSEQ